VTPSRSSAASPPALRRALANLAGGAGAPGELLADRPDGTVVRVGDKVAKAHAPDTDVPALAVRLHLASSVVCRGILLPPLPGPCPAPLPGGRVASLWPHGRPVDPHDAAQAPWEAAGTLLARLHELPLSHQLPGPLPVMRGPAKAARAVARMRGAPHTAHRAAARTVERAWATLPAWCRDEEPAPYTGTLCHGDFHLGQLVRHPAPAGPWHLIDVDDLGLGDPAWDLARPACWYAAGLLEPAAWARFLGAYASSRRAAGTTTGLAAADPWPHLDAAARALTVQSAALGVAKATAGNRGLDDAEEAVVAACARIAGLHDRTEQPFVQGP